MSPLNFSQREKVIQNATQISPLHLPILRHFDQLTYACATFYTHNNFPLFYRMWRPKKVKTPEKIILRIHGLHSHSEKFVLIADKCYHKNWAIIGLDLRNHGLSYKKP